MGKPSDAGDSPMVRSTPSCFERSTLVARRELPVGRADVLFDNPLLREPLKKEHVKPRWSGIGARPRAELRLRALESRHQAARSRHDLHHRIPARSGPASWRTRGSKARTRKRIRTSR
jgi:hypothetical protein